MVATQIAHGSNITTYVEKAKISWNLVLTKSPHRESFGE